ncbi:GNAT family N-acetyltransferase [Paractinoplanes lichenicola]|uniref:N-acetyltransferase n=1 Tax=Paractinoplanes lichenicola TaxID=2802976 RepID=A0ABS1VP51_9ACTN|nr:GNAT family N-acetyltransferase [Actinoplanes lichenicola]MBL7256415.1 N-acetyltransferase [Actinoplanes lichenicola]
MGVVKITDVPEKDRFEARDDDGTLLGVITYQVTGNVIAYTHTKVEPDHEHQGVGGELARAAMEDAKAKGRLVVPICPFLSAWLDDHHDYDQLVARQHRRVK